jgi:hypothetical protein
MLRIVAAFHNDIFSDPDSPSGLNKVKHLFLLVCVTTCTQRDPRTSISSLSLSLMTIISQDTTRNGQSASETIQILMVNLQYQNCALCSISDYCSYRPWLRIPVHVTAIVRISRICCKHMKSHSIQFRKPDELLPARHVFFRVPACVPAWI